jgi:integrase
VFFRLSAATGLRPSEQAALMWGDLDVEKGTVSVRRSIRWIGSEYGYYPPKTPHSRRTIGIPEVLVAELAEAGAGRNRNALIFQMANGLPHSPRNLRTYFKHTLRQAGLLHDDQEEGDAEPANEAVVPDERILEEMGRRRGFRLYDLRHTHATHLLKDRTRLLDVSRRLGHASVAFTLDTYGHVLSEMQGEAAASSGRILELEKKGVGKAFTTGTRPGPRTVRFGASFSLVVPGASRTRAMSDLRATCVQVS